MSPAWNPNDYETVDSRIHRFYELFPNGRLITELVDVTRVDGKVIQWVVKSYAFRDAKDLEPASTGYAEELVGSSPVNRTSSLENAETSSLGRCLANLGLSPKGTRPSLEEMQKVERVQDQKPKTSAKPKPSRDWLDGHARAMNAATAIEQLDSLANEVAGYELNKLDRDVMRDIYLKRKTYLTTGEVK